MIWTQVLVDQVLEDARVKTHAHTHGGCPRKSVGGRSSGVFQSSGRGSSGRGSSGVFQQGKSMEINGTTTEIDYSQNLDKDHQLPTTAGSSCPSLHCRSDESRSGTDYTGESLEQQSLGQRTVDSSHQLPTTARLTQGTSMEDNHVTRQSLDQRFGDSNSQPPMTASHHLWSMVKVQDSGLSGINRPSLDQRFSCTGHLPSSSGSAAQRPTPLSGSEENGESGRSLVTAGQLPPSVTYCSSRTWTRTVFRHWLAGL